MKSFERILRYKVKSRYNFGGVLKTLVSNMLVFHGFPKVSGGPGGFKKVREAARNNFLQFSSKSDLMVRRYGPQTKKVNDLTRNDYYIVNIKIKKDIRTYKKR